MVYTPFLKSEKTEDLSFGLNPSLESCETINYDSQLVVTKGCSTVVVPNVLFHINVFLTFLLHLGSFKSIKNFHIVWCGFLRF